MPFSERLGDPVGNGKSMVSSTDQHIAVNSSGQTPLIQLCVVVEKDERGYGLTVSGDKPVHVQSVKENGASARAGVQQGDRIYKVNGSSVANFDHTEVVSLIKSAGSSVSLTLLRKPDATKSDKLRTSLSQSIDGSDKITSPIPISALQEQQVIKEKIDTVRRMLEEAQINESKLQQEHSSKMGNQKIAEKLNDARRTVTSVKQQLNSLVNLYEQKESQELTAPGRSPNKGCDEQDGNEVTHDGENWRYSASAESVTSPMSDEAEEDEGSRNTSVSINTQLSKTSSLISSDIISMEDDDFPLESQDVVKDHGPFNDLEMLKLKHAHCSVFLSFLLSNGDPSSLLFSLITDIYQQGSLRDMKRWAYEIHSTFLVPGAPLLIKADDSIVNGIERILKDKVKSDRDECLKSVFNEARNHSHQEIKDYLADFRMKRDMGLGTLFGDTELSDNMDRSTEIATIEKGVKVHFDKYITDESPRSQAMCFALATVLKDWGVSHGGMERHPSFAMKDVNKTTLKTVLSSKLKKSKENIRNHTFQPHIYHMTTLCEVCKAIMWGVGFQGYQCKECELNVHKECLNMVQPCKKNKNRSKRLSLIPGKMTKSTSNSSTKFHIGLPYSGSMFSSQGTMAKSSDILPKRSSSYGSMLPEELATDEDVTRPNVSVLRDQFERGTSTPELDVNKKGSTSSDTVAHLPPPQTNVTRSGSFKQKFPTRKAKDSRRAKSDVDKDGVDVLKAIEKSQSSSSASSLSNRSDSSSNERMNDPLKAAASDPDSDLEVETSMPALEGVIPKDQLRKMKPKEKKRQEVINELFYTEKSHVRNLKLLERLFYRPMANAEFCSKDLVQLVFPGIHQLIQIHVQLNNEMKKKMKENPVVTVKDVADLLISRFHGEAGDEMKAVCSQFCQNHTYALKVLKDKRKRDTKLHELFHAAETNRLCRRLLFKDLIIAEVHRLTKYPLFIDTLSKYTSPNSEEHSKLLRAATCSRVILDQVNHAVKECENHHKLVALQQRLDKKPIQNSDNPLVVGYKDMDLTKYKLVYDGPLTWRFGHKKQIDLHVVLLEQILVLLQIQDDGKLVLKCQSQLVQASNEKDKFTHSPVITLNTLLLRQVATDKKAFFFINTSQLGPQIYEVVASTQEEKKRWFKYISEAAENQRGSAKYRQPQVVNVNVSSLTLTENTEDQGSVNDDNSIKAAERYDENTEKESGNSGENFPSKSTAELIREKDYIIEQAMAEKKKLLADRLSLSEDEFDTVAEVAGQMKGERDAKALLLASISDTMRLQCLSPSVVEELSPMTENDASPQLISSIAACISQRLNCLLDVIEETEAENERLKLQLETAEQLLKADPKHSSRPNSYISSSSIENYAVDESNSKSPIESNISEEIVDSSFNSDSDDDDTIYADTKEDIAEQLVNTVGQPGDSAMASDLEAAETEMLSTTNDSCSDKSYPETVVETHIPSSNSSLEIVANDTNLLVQNCDKSNEANNCNSGNDAEQVTTSAYSTVEIDNLNIAAKEHVDLAMMQAMNEMRETSAFTISDQSVQSTLIDCDAIQVDIGSDNEQCRLDFDNDRTTDIDESDESDALSAGSLD